MTPQEMATWLARETDLIHRCEGDHSRQAREATLDTIVDWMRQQPTDAHKIEALEAAASAGFWGKVLASPRPRPRDGAMTYLTTRDVADVLAIKNTRYVLALIEDGRLACDTFREYADGRRHPRIRLNDLCAYLRRYDPVRMETVSARWPDAA